MSKTIRQLWRSEFSQEGFCTLCGNTGLIDVRRRTPNGCQFDSHQPCICPNGRARKVAAAHAPAGTEEP